MSNTNVISNNEEVMKEDQVLEFNYNDGNIETKLLEKWDQHHFIHPWAEMFDDKPEFGVIAKGDGVFLYDRAGKKYSKGSDLVDTLNSLIKTIDRVGSDK